MGERIGGYADDSPQTDPIADRLGVAPFAERLAEILAELNAPNGYVVGLSGEWGSGKTSAINYVKHFLTKRATQKADETATVLTLDFRPWLVSGHEDLVSAFFKVLAEELKHRPPRWKSFAAGGAAVGAELSGLLSKVGWLTSHTDAGALVMTGAVLRKGLNKVAENWAARPSLQKTYDELRDILKYSATKILVVIDDVDRLQTDEIRAMMMMVKTVGQLPNVIYLLSYDRNVVWPALQSGAPLVSRTNFAEKLVQQEVALPVPGFDRLLAMLLEAAAFLSIDTKARRWGELQEVALQRWLRTPRDAIRLANNMRFCWPVLQDHLDPIDYVAIEGARTFNKTLFDWIRDNPSFLFGTRHYSYKPNAAFTEAQAFKARLLLDEVEATLDVAKFLFPNHRKYFDFKDEEQAKGKAIATAFGESEESIIDRKGVNFAPSYDAYFRLYTPSDVLGSAQIAEFFAHVDDEAYLYTALAEGATERREYYYGWAIPLFEAVRARISARQEQSVTVSLLRAAFRVFGDLCTGDPALQAQERQQQAEELFETVARGRTADDVVDLFRTLSEGDGALYALTVAAERVRRLQDRLGIEQDTRDRIVALVRDYVQRAADEDRLRGLPSLHAALTVWSGSEGDLSSPRAWLDQHLEEPWLLPHLGLFFGEYLEPISPRHGQYSIGNVIPAFFNLPRLKAAVDLCLDAKGEDVPRVLATLQRALADHLARPASSSGSEPETAGESGR